MPKRRRGLNRHSFVKEYSEWVNSHGARSARLEEPIQSVRAILASAQNKLSYDRRISISTKMARLGPFYQVMGTVRCFADQVEGWRLIKRGLLYSHWNHRIAARARDFWEEPTGQPKGHYELAMSLADVAGLGLAIARSEAVWSLTEMERGVADWRVEWLFCDYFAAYLVRLFQKLKRQEDIPDIPPDAEPWEHPFGELIDHWDNETQLAEAIRRMCDYHLRWNNEDTEEHDAEFSSPYTMINPIEIHALRAVREELGLAMPEVDHEL